MKIFLSYKFSGSDKEELKNMIENVSNDIYTLGHETFCFYRDIQKWGSVSTDRFQIIPIALSNIDKSDALLLIITTAEKSTGIGVEAGYARAKGVKILLAKKLGIESDYLESISEKVVTFDKDFPTKTTLQSLLSN